jgi:hypothetical protein
MHSKIFSINKNKFTTRKLDYFTLILLIIRQISLVNNFGAPMVVFFLNLLLKKESSVIIL